MWHCKGCCLDKKVWLSSSKGDSNGTRVLDGSGNDGDIVDSDVQHMAVCSVLFEWEGRC